MTGKDKRSVEADYRFYDPPEVILTKLRSPAGYRRSKEKLNLRDLALGSLLYLTTARVTEVVGGPVKVGRLPGVSSENFHVEGHFLKVRNLPIIKQRFYYRADLRKWLPIERVEEYPKRIEIPLPLEGDLNVFTGYIRDQLEATPEGSPLFNMSSTWAYVIINKRTGEFPHYLRDMGLKLWYRLLRRDPFKLKEFSGHKRWDNLDRYMRELAAEDYSSVIKFKMRPGDARPIREFITE